MNFNVLGLNTTHVLVCYDNEWINRCPTGRIHVFVSADFGIHPGVNRCTNSNLNCGDPVHTLSTLQTKCSGNQKCQIKASWWQFKNNCRLNWRKAYLTFQYSCIPGKVPYSLLFPFCKICRLKV